MREKNIEKKSFLKEIVILKITLYGFKIISKPEMQIRR